MKFYLFNINDPYPAYESFREPSLGLGYIKSYSMKSCNVENLSIKILKYNVLNILQKEQPDIIGISSVTQDYSNAIEFAYKIKKRGIQSIIILGGIHIGTLPESLDPVFDIGVVGEGEETIREVLELISKYGLDKPRFKEIRGLVFYDDRGNLALTQKRELTEDLDRLPFPSRNEMGLKTFVTMLTSRGCPFKCSFCSSTTFWGRKIRYNSPEYVVSEMLYLITKHKAKHISIWDDLFTINVKRMAQIAQLMKKENKYFKNISFGVTARASVVSKELCELMREINVIRVGMGLESGSDIILKKIKGNDASVEGNRKAIELLKKYNFNVISGFIIGLPKETLTDLKKTYNFIINSNLDGGTAYLAVPYPGTALWYYAYKNGFVNKNMNFSRLQLVTDFSHLSENSDFILLSENISKKEIIEMGNRIQQYFALRNALSLFNRKTFNLRNILMVVRHPFTFLPFIAGTIKKVIVSYFKRVSITIKLGH